jgi:hypothetical protein
VLGLFLLSLSGGFFVAEVMAHGFSRGTPVEVNCGDILGPGGHYKLANDLKCPCDTEDLDENLNVKPALTIVGPITVDLNGKTIACEPCEADQCEDGTKYSIIGIHMKGKRAKVSNGTIIRCNVGVVVGEDVDPPEKGHHKILNVRVLESQEVLYLDEEGECSNFKGDGIVFESTHNSAVRNELLGNQNDGIDPKAGYNLIKENSSIGNGGRGYNIDGDHNWVIGNQALVNVNDGIEIDEGVGIKVIRNTAIGNGERGIEVRDGAQNSSIKFNKAIFNDNRDLQDRNDDCDDNRWRWNTFDTNKPNCIQ